MSPIHVLFVCTGNVFRSPMAHAYLGAMVLERDLDITVESVGTLEGERTISPSALEVIGVHGLDMSEHRSNPLDNGTVERADLILGMTREHVREIVLVDPEAWRRTFTLKELVRRGEERGPRSNGQPLSEWLDEVSAGRSRDDLMGWSIEDDVEDPLDKGMTVYRETGRELLDLVGRALRLIEPEN